MHSYMIENKLFVFFFLFLPAVFLYFKKFFLIKQGYLESGGKPSWIIDWVCTAFLIIFNIHCLINTIK